MSDQCVGGKPVSGQRQAMQRAHHGRGFQRWPDPSETGAAPPRKRESAFVEAVTTYILLPLLAFEIFRKTLLLEEEEEEEEAGLVGGYDRFNSYRPSGLRANQIAYLTSIESVTERYSRMARIRLRRHYATSAGAIACASAVPVVVAAGLPGWVAAALGGAAALAQGVQQVLQDQRLGAESHAIAVEMSTSIRRFKYESEEVSARQRNALFRAFVDQMEEIRRLSGSRILDLMRTQGGSSEMSTREPQPLTESE